MNKSDYLKLYPQYSHMRDNVKKDKNRLHFHIMPPTGWLNDPNGLCQFKGVYHIYFQYTPFLAGWGTKLWGHYTTKDWLSFKEEEPFLFPDCSWDKDGVYSGSAFVKGDEIHYFYTGNVKLTDKDYDYIMNGREQNTIHITSKDGMCYEKKHLAMTNDDYPSDMSKHVRDPKIYTRDNAYYMIQGARDKNSEGCVLLFRSMDLNNWEYFDRIKPEKNFGYMWECPDMFDIEGQTVLITCPQGLKQQGHDYQNVYQCGYFPIEADFNRKVYKLGTFRELDKGFDIYAPQTFSDEKGRRILIGWMGIPDADYDNEPTVKYDWIHALTMPRVLTWKDGKLLQSPLEEMKQLRKNKLKTTAENFGKQYFKDCCFELHTKFHDNDDFILQLRDDVFFSYENGIVTLKLGESGKNRKTRTAEIKEINNFTVFSDTSSIEIFINNGETVMTTRVYSSAQTQKTEFITKNIAADITAYELDSYTYEF